MKQDVGSRLLGIFFTIVSTIGILFSIAAITGIWLIRPDIKRSSLEILNSFEDVLINTDKSMRVLGSALENTRANLSTIETSLSDLDETFVNVADSLDVAAVLIGDDVRQTVINSQLALSSTAETATLVDKTLSFIASIPLIGANYKPEVPLHISLQQVADELDEIPGSLEVLEQTMEDTSDGIITLNDNLSGLSTDLSGLDNDLKDAQDVLDEYIRIIDQFLDRITNLKTNMAMYLTIVCIFLTGFFFVIAVSQLTVFMFGIAYRKGEQRIVYLSDLRKNDLNAPTTNDQENE